MSNDISLMKRWKGCSKWKSIVGMSDCVMKKGNHGIKENKSFIDKKSFLCHISSHDHDLSNSNIISHEINLL